MKADVKSSGFAAPGAPTLLNARDTWLLDTTSIRPRIMLPDDGGEAGQSLSVRISGEKRGVWSDFATGDKGDLLDLWAACRCTSMAEAIREAKQYLGVRDNLPSPPHRRPTSALPSRFVSPQKAASRNGLPAEG